MKTKKQFTSALFCTLLIASCGEKVTNAPQTSEHNRAPAAEAKPDPRVARRAAPGLTAAQAALRRAQIANVDYRISVTLDDKSNHFSGRVIAETEIARPLQQPLTVDFTGGEVQSVSINGQTIPVQYNGYFITIDADKLKPGPNSIAIEYTHPYSTDGSGLHRFKDPQDGAVYLYTHFEPYKANRFAPLFYQPDLKASYTVDVKTPADWRVVTATREEKVETLADGRRHWHFPASKKFSTYIFPLRAGPFVA
ncbi:Peptidase family M1 [Microbulbifer thermotolerans]|uniref:hypothetical protein n=1 Tax=Microbulbifer thermotolerans TaxID=252514 RepID=UPI0008F19198|nr:hypothetical protein [Microbulbifer thermotolerans]WKT60202.1 hypothetical protein Q2E61_15010 [Microbulbifer thermotolerans]SFD01757.1 Peptidase family M1 [Microbulbifer thermotolerans]